MLYRVLRTLVGSVHLRILSSATDLLFFWSMYFICESHFSLLPSIMPRNLVYFISSMVCPFILMETGWVQLRFLNTIKWVLLKLMISLFAVSHSRMCLNSVSMSMIASSNSSALHVIVESSAN